MMPPLFRNVIALKMSFAIRCLYVYLSGKAGIRKHTF